jgi:hypothetical protein
MQTTRAQVLMTLGEPDGRAADDSWFLYESVANRGGGQWLVSGVELIRGSGGAIPLGNWDVATRVTIKFSEDGTVSKASAERKECNQWGGTVDYGLSKVAGDCPDPRGSDLVADDAKARAFTQAGKVVTQYSNYWFLDSKAPGCTFPGLFTSTPHQGHTFIVGETGITWQEASGGWQSLSFSDIQGIGPLEKHGLKLWLFPVVRRDGSCIFLAVSNGLQIQKPVQEEARAAILAGVPALQSAPPGLSATSAH